ncbi:MAG: transglycosylase family protein [Solirubrobacterales bacterium]|nr:transglycosylase family protein [Solirubrobacterales bacterium]
MRPISIGRKRRLSLPAAGALLLALPASAAALTAGLGSFPGGAKAASASAHGVTVKRGTARTAAQRGCKKLLTVKMGEGAANLIYSGSGEVSGHALKVLGYIERCQRNPAAQDFVRGYDHYQAQMHRARVVTAEEAAAARASQQSGASGGWAIPGWVVQCESGGENLPPNYAGASGYYQIIPSTWQAYGGTQYAPSAYQATAEQQAAVASRIWNGGAGAGQWVCAGRG